MTRWRFSFEKICTSIKKICYTIQYTRKGPRNNILIRRRVTGSITITNFTITTIFYYFPSLNLQSIVLHFFESDSGSLDLLICLAKNKILLESLRLVGKELTLLGAFLPVFTKTLTDKELPKCFFFEGIVSDDLSNLCLQRAKTDF